VTVTRPVTGRYSTRHDIPILSPNSHLRRAQSAKTAPASPKDRRAAPISPPPPFAFPNPHLRALLLSRALPRQNYLTPAPPNLASQGKGGSLCRVLPDTRHGSAPTRREEKKGAQPAKTAPNGRRRRSSAFAAAAFPFPSKERCKFLH
jgi:hypothetical protein